MADTQVMSTPNLEKKGRGRPKSVKTTVAKSTPKVKQPKVKAAPHPPASEMILAAVTNLNEKGGTSLQAIKKYISTEFKLDSSKAAIFIRKALVNAVASGKLVRTKGTGASGSFKFPSKDQPKKKKTATKKPSPKKTSVAKKPKATGTTSKPTSKKLDQPKKKKTATKKPSPKKTSVAKKPKATGTTSKPTSKKLKATSKPKKALKTPKVGTRVAPKRK